MHTRPAPGFQVSVLALRYLGAQMQGLTDLTNSPATLLIRCLRPGSNAVKQLEQRLPPLRLQYTRSPVVVASAAAITADYSTPAPKPLALPWPVSGPVHSTSPCYLEC